MVIKILDSMGWIQFRELQMAAIGKLYKDLPKNNVSSNLIKKNIL